MAEIPLNFTCVTQIKLFSIHAVPKNVQHRTLFVAFYCLADMNIVIKNTSCMDDFYFCVFVDVFTHYMIKDVDHD